MHQIYCITNGNKKINAKNNQILAALKRHFGEQFHLYKSTNSKAALTYIHSLGQYCTHLLGVGGDGTFNVLINGVCSHPDPTFQPILGILPNGTGNDFYRSAGFIQTYDFINNIKSGSFEHFDIGVLETADEKRYFANIADIGFGGAVVLELLKFRKNFGPNFSYGLAIVKTFLRYKRPIVELQTKDFHYSGELLLAAFCNGSIFGDGLHIHPDAQINDGKLKLTLLGKVSLFDYLSNVLKVKRGKKIKHTEAHYLQISFPIYLQGVAEHLHAETDGEYMVGREFKIDLYPGKLKLLPFTQL
jgi:YegS/Rv2252/BmrU family lipid kinase